MSRWWRAYDEAVDDPKLILLSDKAHRAWFNLMCIASLHGGVLPDIKVVAVKLRVSVQRAVALITELSAAGLVDRRDDGKFEPHNWELRQFKSDVTDPTAAERMRNYRNRKRNGPVTVTVPREQITEAETDKKDSEPIGSGAEAPTDHRKRLFDEGLPKLATLTGKGPDACRSFVGKCLKAAGDDAVTVLGLIEDAERNQVVNPSAWIAARLKPVEMATNGRPTIHDAARSLSRELQALNEPAPGLCEPAGGGALRLLPAR